MYVYCRYTIARLDFLPGIQRAVWQTIKRRLRHILPFINMPFCTIVSTMNVRCPNALAATVQPHQQEEAAHQ